MAKMRGRPVADNSELPLPVMVDKRWVWRRPDIENFRRVLEGRPLKTVKTSAADELVTISQLAAELGVSRRTVTRRIELARAARAAKEADTRLSENDITKI